MPTKTYGSQVPIKNGTVIDITTVAPANKLVGLWNWQEAAVWTDEANTSSWFSGSMDALAAAIATTGVTVNYIAVSWNATPGIDTSVSVTDATIGIVVTNKANSTATLGQIITAARLVPWFDDLVTVCNLGAWNGYLLEADIGINLTVLMVAGGLAIGIGLVYFLAKH